MRLLDETLNEIGRFFVMDGSTDLSLHEVAWIHLACLRFLGLNLP